MRYMLIVKSSKACEAGQLPSADLIDAIGKYNEELIKAGVLVDFGGLRPSSQGVRIRYSNGKQSVTDGPFAETKELIGGYWIINVKSKEEAVQWALRIPAPRREDEEEGEIEIRSFYGFEDIAHTLAVGPAQGVQLALPT